MSMDEVAAPEPPRHRRPLTIQDLYVDVLGAALQCQQRSDSAFLLTVAELFRLLNGITRIRRLYHLSHRLHAERMPS
jgi:hypothetical protein